MVVVAAEVAAEFGGSGSPIFTPGAGWGRLA
jgi:hypothetical protein